MDNKAKNLAILLPIIAGIAYAGFLLFSDYRHSQTNVQGNAARETVGELVSADNNVKRQFDGDVVWNSVEKAAPLYNRDSLRTGKDSAAVVKLNDGSVIELGESSLIVLDKSPDSLNVNFKAGDLLAKNSGQSLAINVKDSKIKGDKGAELKLKTGVDTKTQIQVAKGKASVTDKNKKKMDIGESEQAELDDTGVKEVPKIPVVLKTPLDKTLVTNNLPETSQPFSWQVSDKNLKEEQFEVSKSAKFAPGETKILKGHQALTANLSPGSYFWRVGWMKKDKMNYTEARALTIAPDRRLELIHPDPGTRFNVNPDENSVELEWNSKIQPKGYTIEIATSKDFKSIASTLTSKDTKDAVKDLPSGNYFWRVRAFGDKNEEIAASPVSTFSVRVKVPKLPELIRPNDNAVWENPNEAVEFSWKKLDKAADYRIVLSSDPEQKEIVKTASDPKDVYSWHPPKEGSYYWSVKAVDGKKSVVGQSDVRKLNYKPRDLGPAFALVAPKDKSEITKDLSGTPEPLIFSWNVLRKLPGPVSIQVSRDPEFKDAVKQENLPKNQMPVRLRTAGIYYWRVSSRSPDGKTEDVSPVGTFTLKGINNLIAPTVTNPLDKDSIEVSEPTPVKFEWKPVSGAASYHVVVQRQDPRTKQPVVVVDQSVADSKLLSKPLPEGNYTWMITSVDTQNQEGLVGRPYTFNIVPPTQMDAPQLNAPVVK